MKQQISITTYQIQHFHIFNMKHTLMITMAFILVLVLPAHGSKEESDSPMPRSLETVTRADWRARCKSRRDTCYTVARVSAQATGSNPDCVYNACCSCYYACNRSSRFVYRKDCLNVKRAWAEGSCSKSKASYRDSCPK